MGERRQLLDNSAWTRLYRPGIADERADQVSGAIEAGLIVASLPFALEAGYSARDLTDHDSIMREIGALPFLGIDSETEKLTIESQQQLARAGHHRLPPPDLIIAALAAQHNLDVLHYDAHYDVIRERTNLEFESVWLAEHGTL
ncbi:MAG: PIN domain-containing protein [Solirubrobacterales bacterium]